MDKEFSLNTFKRVVVINRAPSRYNRSLEDNIKTAYVGNADDQKQIDTGLSWAGDTSTNKAEVKYFDNDNFTLEIKSCPERSSQGGKLSFWMCKITSEDGYSFFTSINSLLLEQLLKESTFIKGVCQDKVLFVRNKSQLGVITKTGKLYQQLLNDEYIRNNPKKKTIEYNVGDVLEDLRTRETYLGQRYSYFEVEYNESYINHILDVTVNIFNKPKECYFYLDCEDWWTGEEKCSGISNLWVDCYTKDCKIITNHRDDIKTFSYYIDKEFSRDTDWGNEDGMLFEYRVRESQDEKLDLNVLERLVRDLFTKKVNYYHNSNWKICIQMNNVD